MLPQLKWMNNFYIYMLKKFMIQLTIKKIIKFVFKIIFYCYEPNCFGHSDTRYQLINSYK